MRPPKLEKQAREDRFFSPREQARTERFSNQPASPCAGTRPMTVREQRARARADRAAAGFAAVSVAKCIAGLPPASYTARASPRPAEFRSSAPLVIDGGGCQRGGASGGVAAPLHAATLMRSPGREGDAHAALKPCSSRSRRSCRDRKHKPHNEPVREPTTAMMRRYHASAPAGMASARCMSGHVTQLCARVVGVQQPGCGLQRMRKLQASRLGISNALPTPQADDTLGLAQKGTPMRTSDENTQMKAPSATHLRMRLPTRQSSAMPARPLRSQPAMPTTSTSRRSRALWRGCSRRSAPRSSSRSYTLWCVPWCCLWPHTPER